MQSCLAVRVRTRAARGCDHQQRSRLQCGGRPRKKPKDSLCKGSATVTKGTPEANQYARAASFGQCKPQPQTVLAVAHKIPAPAGAPRWRRALVTTGTESESKKALKSCWIYDRTPCRHACKMRRRTSATDLLGAAPQALWSHRSVTHDFRRLAIARAPARHAIDRSAIGRVA